MVKHKSNIIWAAGFENRSSNSINRIKQPKKTNRAQHDVEKHLNETLEHTSGIERLYRLAGCLLEKQVHKGNGNKKDELSLREY